MVARVRAAAVGVGEAFSHAVEDLLHAGDFSYYLGRLVERKVGTAVFFSPQEVGASQASAATAAAPLRRPIPSLVTLAARAIIDRPQIAFEDPLIHDLQAVLLSSARTIELYKKVVAADCIETEQLNAFCAQRLLERHVVDFEAIEDFEEFKREKAQEFFYEMIFDEMMLVCSKEEKRELIFRSEHALAAPFVIRVMRVKRLVGYLLSQLVTNVLMPLSRAFMALSLATRRAVGALLGASAVITLYSAAYLLQRHLWMKLLPAISFVLSPIKGWALVQVISKVAFALLHYQPIFLGLFGLALGIHVVVSRLFYSRAGMPKALKVALGVILAPSYIFLPPLVIVVGIGGLTLERGGVLRRLLDSTQRALGDFLKPLNMPTGADLSVEEQAQLDTARRVWVQGLVALKPKPQKTVLASPGAAVGSSTQAPTQPIHHTLEQSQIYIA